MAELDSLIRVRKHTVEQKQKALAALYKKEQDLKDKRDELEAQHVIEAEKARNMDADYMGYFGAYSKRLHAEIESIDRARSKLENLIRLAQEDIREAFADLKKIEIIDERRKAEEKAALDKKESDELDQIAIEGYRRQGEE